MKVLVYDSLSTVDRLTKQFASTADTEYLCVDRLVDALVALDDAKPDLLVTEFLVGIHDHPDQVDSKVLIDYATLNAIPVIVGSWKVWSLDQMLALESIHSWLGEERFRLVEWPDFVNETDKWGSIDDTWKVLAARKAGLIESRQ